MDAGDGAAGFAASAADAVDELWDYVVEFAFGCELVHFYFDFWSFIILDWQPIIPLLSIVHMLCCLKN
jgi:hypothetical protein